MSKAPPPRPTPSDFYLFREKSQEEVWGGTSRERKAKDLCLLSARFCGTKKAVPNSDKGLRVHQG